MTRLDFRQIEDVVDKGQEVVARRFDRAGKLDLFGRKVAVGIVAQQLGKDQQRIERRAQLVAHVGKEVRLVLAGLLKLASLKLQRGSGARKLVTLALQSLRLFFKLAVGLFQFDLLQFQPGLRFLQRIPLLLQFLVGDPQFLALRLQFASLALRFLQRVLQALAETRRAQGDADRA